MSPEEEEGTLPPYCLQTEDYNITSAGISRLLACLINFRLASPHNCISQFLKISLSLYTPVVLFPSKGLINTPTKLYQSIVQFESHFQIQLR